MLQVQHFPGTAGNGPDKEAKVTINSYCLQTVVSSDVEINGTKLKEVVIFYVDGDPNEPLVLNVNSFDAMAIEAAVGLVPEF